MRAPSDATVVSYADFLTLCRVEDPNDWIPGLRVTPDGVWVKDVAGDVLSPLHEKALLSQHPDGDPSKPVVVFPCTLGTIRTRICDFYGGGFIDPFDMADFLISTGQRDAKPETNASAAQRHRRNREHLDVLRVVLAVLWNFPPAARKVTNLAQQVDEKAPLFWPETGKPPLGTRQLRDLIAATVKLP